MAASVCLTFLKTGTKNQTVADTKYLPETLNSCTASLLKCYSDVSWASFRSSSFAQIRYSFSDNNLSGYSTILSYDSNFDNFILPSFHLFQKQIQVLTFQKICFYLHQ